MKFAPIVKMNNGWPLLLLAATLATGLAAPALRLPRALGEEKETRPEPPPVLKPMDNSYNVLLNFSIFARDHKPAPVTIPVATTHPNDSAVAVLSEANFILRGVAMADSRPTAFFEQTTDHQIVKIHLGDPLMHGIVTAGSLDGVDYVVNGKASHIMIGQALDGGMALTSAPSADSGNAAVHKWARSHHQD